MNPAAVTRALSAPVRARIVATKASARSAVLCVSSAGVSTTGGEFSALYFDANQYSPGQVISTATLPTGVIQTDLTDGPQVGLTASNPDYLSPVYGAFTDFGTPASRAPGVSVGGMISSATASRVLACAALSDRGVQANTAGAA